MIRYINTRRYRCQNCFKTFYEALPDIDDKRLITVAQDAATKANIAAKKSGEEAAELRGQLNAAAKKPARTV